MKKMLMILTVMNVIMAFCSDPKPEGGPYKETKDGIDWLFVVDSKLQANVSSGDWLLPAISRETKGSITIPSVLGGHDVSSIGDYAFYGCDYLTSASIPPSVTSIGDCAFWACYELNTIIIPTNMQHIGHGAFCYCTALTNVTIPSSVTNIGASAFGYCISLTEITIPSGVTSIGKWTFSDCSSLNAVDFEGAPPEGVKDAGIKTDAAIRYNVAYEDEWLPVIAKCGFTNASPYTPPKCDGGPYVETVDGVEWIFVVTNLESMVKGADGIAGSVTIPSALGGRTVVAIDNDAFKNCTDMTSVTISASVKTIGASAFEGCGKLVDVYFEGDTMSAIGMDAFRGCYWDLIMHVSATWKGRGRTICGYTVLKGSVFIVE